MTSVSRFSYASSASTGKTCSVVPTASSRASALCAAHAERLDEPADAVVQWVLQCLEWQLKYEVMDPSDTRVELLDKDKQGTLGFIHRAVGRWAIQRTITAWATDLAESQDGAERSAQSVLELLSVFSDYGKYEAELAPTGVEAESGCDAQEPESGDAEDQLSRLKKKYASMTHARIMEFCYDLMSGVLDEPIKQTLAAKKNIDACKWLEVKELPALREIYRLLNQHRHVVTPKESMPAPGTKTLKRYDSESGRDEQRAQELRKERADAWRQAQNARKKLVHVAWAKISKAQDLQKAYEKTPAFSNFVGKPGEQHRVFIFNAETGQEPQEAPWGAPAEWSGVADFGIKWLLSNKGSADVIFASDGRNRKNRRKIEAAFEEARNVHEAWVVFTPTQRLGRKIAYSADNRESINISMPLSRAQLSTQKRDSFNTAGEESTHETSYTGVAPIPWGALPLLSPADKAKIVGYAPPAPPSSVSKKVFDSSLGLPLYWTERKSPAIWQQLLKHLNATAVFDITPGSGQCARACMQAGIHYSCVAKNAEHGSWLINVLDRMALAQICKEGSPLYQQDLSECLKEHFSETLEQLNEQDGAEETVAEEEAPS